MGSLKLVFALLTVLGILISIASIIYCFWTTRRSASGLVQVQRRLSDNENNHLNQSLPNFEALMLSVQNLGCAGMERLGIPASTAMGAPHSSQRDDSRSIRRSTFPTQHDLIISANRKTQNLLEESKTEPKLGINSEAYESYKRCNVYTSCSLNTNCPPHIHRHDGEFGRDRICNSLSQHNAEIKRSYIQAPPNKSIQDVPDATQSLHTSYYRQLNSHRQPNRSEKMKIQDAFDVSQPFQNSNKKMGEKVKGFFMKIIDNGSSGSGSQKIANSENKVHNNTSTTHRSTYIASSESSNGLKDDSNELLLNGSTNLHSKSYDSNNSLLLGTASKTSLKPSSSSSSSLSSGPSPDHHNCL
ncbi:CLUMA_CG000060, isoform A [Clunio marinus]|uniref:CLUMA_CG000060, isoform A n=1 Tax=Clunio marinus TaxID=568069 RepID=A0A1J1HE58_9DIPT|nr:CLUMA_CG000060, isoform A [Clunio marinus]